MGRIPHWIDSKSKNIAEVTRPFIESKIGKQFQNVVLLGPLTFIPTILTAWTDPNIDSLRTATWPLMVAVNASAFLLVVHEGNWRMRLVSVVWIIVVALVWLATIFR